MNHDLVVSQLFAMRATLEAIIEEVEADRVSLKKATMEGSASIETFDGGHANGSRQTE